MNQNVFIGITLAVLLLISGAWYMSMRTPSAVDTPAEQTPSTSTPSVAAPTQTPSVTPAIKNGNTYKSLLTQKGNYQCDYDQVTDAGKSHNVIYLSGGKLRAEFRTTIGTPAANLSVYDGQYLYTWREGTSVGTKSLVTALGQLPTAIPKDLTSGKIYGDNFESVGWQCHTWLVDKTLLTPPSYVTFK